MQMVVRLILFLVAACNVCSICNAATCKDSPFNTYAYCNTALDVKTRVQDLVNRMTAEEKVSQLGNGAPSIDRLAIPAYQWWSEALHGVAGSPGTHFGGAIPVATSFPQVIGLGATFNMSLVRAMANVISTEARAMHNQDQAGLTFFAPNINILRDPRWGRGQETPGEDPYLTGRYVVQFVKSLQEGNDPRYLKTVATCKHFAAYDLENWNGTDRFHFNAIVTDQDLIETYFPAFKACVEEGNAGSIMCSYNAVNGVPSCANDLFLNNVTRDQWGFDGYVVSDCGAIGAIMSAHHYTSTPEATVAAGLRGGCDLNCGGYYQKNGMDAYNKKAITDNDLNTAISRLMTFRMRLGMFDPPEGQPYATDITPSDVNTTSSQDLALEAARQSVVLLKNDGSLPLDKSRISSIALVGPNGDATKTMQGNYYGTPPFLISPKTGLENLGLNVTFYPGCKDVACSDDSGFADAAKAAQQAQAVVAVVGLDQGQEREGHDRTDLVLPGKQEELLTQVKSAAGNKPFIVVLMSGGPVDISSAKSSANAVLWVGYPGQAGGQAIADVLFGNFNPSGKLPMTFYPAAYTSQISFFDMGMRTSPGRTYKFYTGTPVFSFGDGLSYTTFTIQWSELPEPLSLSRKELNSVTPISYKAKVTNTGKVAGGIAVLAFVSSDVPGAPLKELFDFQKVFLGAGESATLFFAAESRVFSTVDAIGKKTVRPGRYNMTIEGLTHSITIY